MNITNEIQALRSANAGLMETVKRMEQERESLHAKIVSLQNANSRLREGLTGILAALNGSFLTNAIQRGKDLL